MAYCSLHFNKKHHKHPDQADQKISTIRFIGTSQPQPFPFTSVYLGKGNPQCRIIGYRLERLCPIHPPAGRFLLQPTACPKALRAGLTLLKSSSRVLHHSCLRDSIDADPWLRTISNRYCQAFKNMDRNERTQPLQRSAYRGPLSASPRVFHTSIFSLS